MPDDLLPKDVRDSLENSGVEFDEHGNIIESKFINTDEEDDEDQDDQDNQDVDDQDDDQGDDQDGQDDDDQDDDDDDDENEDDEDEDEPQSRQLKLTKIRERRQSEERVSTKKFEDTQARILAEIEAMKTSRKSKKDDDDDDEADDDGIPPQLRAGLKELEKEAKAFKRQRLKDLARTVEREVNELNLGAKFSDITSSEEWADYLNSRVYGTKVEDLYRAAVQESNSDDIVEFFSDFTERYLPKVQTSRKVSKTVKTAIKTKSTKAPLDDLAVPAKSAAKSKPRRTKFDFKDTDYAQALEQFERGRMSHEKFLEFEGKFETALSKGRVKTTM